MDMKRIWLIVCSLCVASIGLKAQEVVSASLPGVSEYIHLDQEPILLNLTRVRNRIGYPLEAYKKGIEGKVYCRVLVSPKGNCIGAMISRSDHYLLSASVERHLSELKFLPASVGEQKIACWTNVLVLFELSRAKSFLIKKKSDRWWDGWILQGHAARKYWRKGESLMQAGKWEAAERAYSMGLARYPHQFHPNGSQRVEFANALKARGWLQLQLGAYNRASQSLSESIVWGEIHGSKNNNIVQWLPEIYLMRAKARLGAGQPLDALADCRWVLETYPEAAITPQVQIEVGLIQAHIGDYAAALNVLQQVIEQGEARDTALLYKANILLMMGNEGEACRCLGQIDRERLSAEWDWKVEQVFRRACRNELFSFRASEEMQESGKKLPKSAYSRRNHFENVKKNKDAKLEKK